MLAIRLVGQLPTRGRSVPLAVPVEPAGAVARPLIAFPDQLSGPVHAFLADVEHTGQAGSTHALPRPGQRPARLLLVGVGDGGEAQWRAAGAALTRQAKDTALHVQLPDGLPPAAVRGLAEGLLLAGYRYRLGAPKPGARLATVTVAVPDPDRYAEVLATARTVAASTELARDLTNTPSLRKSPAWFAGEITRAAADTGLRVTVDTPVELAEQGFGGLLAVGGGATRGPRLVRLSWRPRGAGTHVVLVGKGITFDTGGLSIKSRDGMKLMRKDMGGAAAICAATVGAARMRLPVRITALAPLAENMPGASAYRPGDVVRHYGGRSTEVLNTDAEGRLVLADALAYAAARLAPDYLVDLATLTGANAVSLGKRTAALYSEDDALADQLRVAAEAAGERVWRMPLPEDYLEHLASDIADVVNSTEVGAGSVLAALYLRGFTGAARSHWAHLDMSAPAWSDSADGELAKGATGWGVRTLLRWLESLAG